MGLDKYTKQQAEEYADNEAELGGFSRQSPSWKAKVDEYSKFAVSTMSVGRNPRMMMNPSVHTLKKFFPELFSDGGVSGQLAKYYADGATTTTAIDQRLMSAITNMVKLFEAGRLSQKTGAKGKYGKIENSEMSDFQLPKRAEGMSDEAYSELSKAVLKNWVTRDLLTALFIESILPFFLMTKDDVEQMYKAIHAVIQSKGDTIRDYQEGGTDSPRYQFITALHGAISKKMAKVNFRKMIFGQSAL